MDFEWQGYGPVDVTSPFHRYAMESSKKRKLSKDQSVVVSQPEAGSHTQLDSPQKSQLPSFTEPNGKPFFFSQMPATPGQASPFRNPSFTTPHKPIDIDFSSGPENSSPIEADNDETPEATPYKFTSGSTKASNKRNSLFGLYGKFAPSPRAGAPYNDALERKIHKRRRRALNLSQNSNTQLVLARQSSDDTDSDEAIAAAARAISSPSKRSPTKSKSQKTLPAFEETPPPGLLTKVFTFISTYPDAPLIISRYLQVFFNFLILTGIFYLLYSFYATIQSDVDRASDEAMAEVLSEMSLCSKQYIENQCGADARLPALETICSNWEICINRDPAAVKRARLSAHTFAEIFNSFVEPISLKTMAFTSALIVLSIVVSNATFTFYRRQYESHHHDQDQGYGGQYQQYPSGQWHPGPYANSQPYQGQLQHSGWNESPQKTNSSGQGQLEWNRSPSKDHGRGRSRSPEKRS